MKIININAVVVLILVASACSSGNNGQTLRNGSFVDSPVNGLRYETPSQSGVTDSSGTFQYQEGEDIAFFLGDIKLGTTLAAGELSPLDLVGAESINDAVNKKLDYQLTNLLIFLQSLDRDHNPDNGIDLTGLNDALIGETLEFGVTPIDFQESAYKRIVNEQNGYYQSSKKALNHFLRYSKSTVNWDVTLEDLVDLDGDGDTDLIYRYIYGEGGRPREIIELYIKNGESRYSATEITRSTLSYNAQGYIRQLIFWEGNRDKVIFSRSYQYDDMGRTTEIRFMNGNEDIVRLDMHAYDSVGNKTSTIIDLPIDRAFYRYFSSYDAFNSFRPYDPNFDKTWAFPYFFNRYNWKPKPFGVAYYIDSNHEFSQSGELMLYSRNDYVVKSENKSMIESFSVEYAQGKKSMFSGLGGHDITYTYSKSGALLGCSFTKNDNVVLDTVYPESALVTYDCGRYGHDEAKTVRDESGNIRELTFSRSLSNNSQTGYAFSTISTQEFDYIDERVVEVRLLQTISGNKSHQSFKYYYSSNGNLIKIEEYAEGILRTSRSRSYQTLELNALP